jgi:hypothetical protein
MRFQSRVSLLLPISSAPGLRRGKGPLEPFLIASQALQVGSPRNTPGLLELIMPEAFAASLIR